MTKCIWCKRSDGLLSLEHVFPEGLGCPDGFVLRAGEVCKTCNNELAHLDQAVIDELDVIGYMNDVPCKRAGNRRSEIEGMLLVQWDLMEKRFLLIWRPIQSKRMMDPGLARLENRRGIFGHHLHETVT